MVALDAGAWRCTSFGHRHHPPIYGCDDCGLLFQWPMPADEELEEAYGGVVDPLYMAERDNRILTFRKVIRSLGPAGGRRLLDVGAYCGYFLEVARERGFRAEGLELSRWAAALRPRPGLHRPRRAARGPGQLGRPLPRAHHVGRGRAPPRPAGGAGGGPHAARARGAAPPLHHRHRQPGGPPARRPLALAHGHAPRLLRPAHHLGAARGGRLPRARRRDLQPHGLGGLPAPEGRGELPGVRAGGPRALPRRPHRAGRCR